MTPSRKSYSSGGEGTWFWIEVGKMVARHDRPQMVLDFIDLIAKAHFGEVWR